MAYVSTRGLGASASQVVGQIGGPASSVGAVALAPTLTAMVPAITPSLAVPIVGVVLAGVLVGIEAILNSGCGQTCIETSQWANQASSQLDQMMKAYFGTPAPRPQSLQTASLGIFQGVWQRLTQLCTQPNLGTAGQNCIADRQDGACKWKALAPQYPGEPATGTCWNWWNAYYYPILNDPDVVPDAQLQTSSVASTVSSGSAASGASASPTAALPAWAWLVAAGVVLWAVL